MRLCLWVRHVGHLRGCRWERRCGQRTVSDGVSVSFLREGFFLRSLVADSWDDAPCVTCAAR